jgi:hypothetical protein
LHIIYIILIIYLSKNFRKISIEGSIFCIAAIIHARILKKYGEWFNIALSTSLLWGLRTIFLRGRDGSLCCVPFTNVRFHFQFMFHIMSLAFPAVLLFWLPSHSPFVIVTHFFILFPSPLLVSEHSPFDATPHQTEQRWSPRADCRCSLMNRRGGRRTSSATTCQSGRLKGSGGEHGNACREGGGGGVLSHLLFEV